MAVDGHAVLGHVFNALLVDGGFGLLAVDGAASFDAVTVETNDPVYQSETGDSDGSDTPPPPPIDMIRIYAVDQPTAVPDRGVAVSTITVTDSFTILDVDVLLDITHTRDSDLRVVLVSPSGTRIELFDGVGGQGDNFTDTVLDDEAATSILDGAAPFTGTYRPVGDLSLLEGEDVVGVWTLEVHDQSKREIGTLNGWSLFVTGGQALLAALQPSPSEDAPATLAWTQLAAIFDVAVQRWLDTGLVDAELAVQLEALSFEIADLPGLVLGRTTVDTVYVDVDAAGFGLFVDPTPFEDSEFAGGTVAA